MYSVFCMFSMLLVMMPFFLSIYACLPVYYPLCELFVHICLPALCVPAPWFGPLLGLGESARLLFPTLGGPVVVLPFLGYGGIVPGGPFPRAFGFHSLVTPNIVALVLPI